MLLRFLALLDACGEACILIFLHPHLTFDCLVERDLCLGLLYIWDLLYRIEEDLHQVVVVKAEYLDKEIVFSCNKMTLNHFGDLFECLDHLGVFVCF